MAVNNYFDNLSFEAAQQLEQLSRLAFELREDRKKLLSPYGVDSEEGLLQRLRNGEIAEHPAYDHYLGARALAGLRDAARSQLQVVMAELGR